jgi:hypothetical protein
LRDYHYDRDFVGEVIDPTNSSLADLRIVDSNYLRRKILFVGDLHMRDVATLFIDQVCRYKHEEELKIHKQGLHFFALLNYTLFILIEMRSTFDLLPLRPRYDN